MEICGFPHRGVWVRIMKPYPFSNDVRKFALGAACLALLAGDLDAKPDKGKGKGGPPGHAQKGNPGKGQGQGKAKNPGKGADKIEKQAARQQKEIRKIEKDHDKADKKYAKEEAKWREARFRDDDRSSILGYFLEYRDRDRGLPPGLAKNLERGKPLPPGWQKKVSRGYVIEDDYYEHFHPVSYDLFPGVQRVPETRLYQYGDRIVRVYEPRREVIDVIHVPTINLPY
jgi:hypothetical protein